MLVLQNMTILSKSLFYFKEFINNYLNINAKKHYRNVCYSKQLVGEYAFLKIYRKKNKVRSDIRLLS